MILNKARAFFSRAEEVASTDNFDYAIDLYLEGLKLAPDALEDGHAPLRRLALIRQAKGGKKPSVVDKMKYRGGKLPVEEMLNAEFLLAKDPDNLDYAETMLKACVAGSYSRTADWIGQLIFDANRASSKPSLATYLLLKDCYVKMGWYTKAVAACQFAVDLKPSDDALRDELRNLSASMTMEKGGYGQVSDFRKSLKDRELQERLHSQEQTVKSDSYRLTAVEEAKRQVKQAPTPPNIMQLAQAYVDLETEEGWKEAQTLLEGAYQKTKDFSFKRKLGEFSIRKLKEGLRHLHNELRSSKPTKEKVDQYRQLHHTLDQTELEHYRLCAENYPTDLKLKFEYGRCLIKNHKFDEAIPVFQETQRDPRLRTAALDKTGLCFLLKGWFDDAIDLFLEALKSSPTKDSAIAKDIRYNLARAYEAANRVPEALEIYRKLAQLEYNYKDVSQRIDKLRTNGHNS